MLVASHFDDQTAYAAVNRFRLDDLKPYIYRTHDGGKTWKLVVNGLPDNASVNVVREDPEQKGLLIAGTERAVWFSADDGDHWQSLQLNLPRTSMRDLVIHDNDVVLGTHGRSFWILDDITPLRQLRAAEAAPSAYLFKPAVAYQIPRNTYSDTPLPPEIPAGQNPPSGAILDYYLKAAPSGQVTLEVFDAAGTLVRRFASTDEVKPVNPVDLTVRPMWIRPPQVLAATAGMHRWVWDLHYTPPATQREYPASAIPHDTPMGPLGPMALPGRYTVKLSVDGNTYTQALAVRLDPRVKTPMAGLTQQFELAMQLVHDMNETYAALQRAGAKNDHATALLKLSADLGGAYRAVDGDDALATPTTQLVSSVAELHLRATALLHP